MAVPELGDSPPVATNKATLTMLYCAVCCGVLLAVQSPPSIPTTSTHTHTHTHSLPCGPPALAPPVLCWSHLVEPLVLVPPVPEGTHGVDVEGVLTLADAGSALLNNRLVQDALVHLCVCGRGEMEGCRKRQMVEQVAGWSGQGHIKKVSSNIIRGQCHSSCRRTYTTVCRQTLSHSQPRLPVRPAP